MDEPRNAPPQPPGEGFDDRRPLVFGCVLFAVIILVLGGAFALGAWSVWTQGGAAPPP